LVWAGGLPKKDGINRVGQPCYKGQAWSRVQLSSFIYSSLLDYPLCNDNMSLIALPFSHLDDDEFTAVIYEFRKGPVRFDPEGLSNISLNPEQSNNLSFFHLNVRSFQNKVD